ncbi:MAG: ABC transporter substrate-binding protein [Planctomycetota bacterium]
MQETLRIISLLPSATEMVCLLGLSDYLVGVSHSCDFPVQVDRLPNLTRTSITDDLTSAQVDSLVREKAASGQGLYSIDEEQFFALEPSLVITQGLCDVCAVSEGDVRHLVGKLQNDSTMLTLNPMRLQEVLEGVQAIGEAAGIQDVANLETEKLQRRIENVQERASRLLSRKKVLFLEWLDPLFTAGHWNPELIELAGGESLLARSGEVSKCVEWADVSECNPDIVIAASCGHSVERVESDLKTILQREELRHFRNAGLPIWAIDGSQFFNRPGPRLVDSLEILAHINDPVLHPQPVAFDRFARPL